MNTAVTALTYTGGHEHHESINAIKPVLNAGHDPSIRILHLKQNLAPYLGERNIKTVCSLARMERAAVLAVLAERDNPEEDLALIEQVLDDAGLNLGMTCEDISHFKEDLK